jgi:xylulokinase
MGKDAFSSGRAALAPVLACDVGGTSLKIALVDDSGAFVAQAATASPQPKQSGGASEIDPNGWWNGLIEAANELAHADAAAFRQIEAIAICGITRTQVFVDRGGEVLRPAISLSDTRIQDRMADLIARLPDHPERAAINAFHPLARVAWLRQDERANFDRLSAVIEPKDFLNLRLTGQIVSDHVSMARLAAAAIPANSGTSLFTALDIPPSIVPALNEPTTRIGVVARGLPAPFDRLAGVPVLCGSNDTWTAVAGLNALRDGVAYNISGTTEVFGVLSQRSVEAEGLVTVDWRGLHQIGGPSQSGADTMAWLLELLGNFGHADASARIEQLLGGTRHPQPLLFLPYLRGERVPYWDAALRGAFVGLSRDHSASDLAYAVLEGVAFLNRIVLARAEQASGTKISEIRFGGGGAANVRWCQIKADICERPIIVGRSSEPGLTGAAVIAWTGLGRFASLQEAQARLIQVAHRYTPDAARAERYRGLFGLFQQAEAALAPVSRGLVALAATPNPTH